MALIIRAAEIKDAPYLSAIRRQDGVRENTLGLVTDSPQRSEAFLRDPAPGRHLLVAEWEGKVVGVAGLTVEQHPRLNHAGSIGISVDVDYQGRGIGKALMKAIIDLSENWLMLLRLELGVIVDNERAIKLYESLGFEKEGIKRCTIKRNGLYMDEYILSKLNPHLMTNTTHKEK